MQKYEKFSSGILSILSSFSHVGLLSVDNPLLLGQPSLLPSLLARGERRFLYVHQCFVLLERVIEFLCFIFFQSMQNRGRTFSIFNTTRKGNFGMCKSTDSKTCEFTASSTRKTETTIIRFCSLYKIVRERDCG